jgi:hypothetical protein
MRPGAVAPLALLLGFIHGWLNGVAIQRATSGALELIGVITALFVIVALVACVRGFVKAALDADRGPCGRELDCPNELTSRRLVASFRAFMKYA